MFHCKHFSSSALQSQHQNCSFDAWLFSALSITLFMYSLLQSSVFNVDLTVLSYNKMVFKQLKWFHFSGLVFPIIILVFSLCMGVFIFWLWTSRRVLKVLQLGVQVFERVQRSNYELLSHVHKYMNVGVQDS